MRVAFLGLGLIGGSIARALRARPGEGWTIAAWTPSGSGSRLAHDAGVVGRDAANPASAVEGADLVVLAAPPLDCLALLGDLAGPLRLALSPDTVITDVASTKAQIVERASELGLRFVGSHPMAGRETAGYPASDPELFRGRPWIIVPATDGPATARVEAVAVACGARAVRMGAAEHDRLVAATSHLPLVLSAALVEAVAGGAGPPRPGWQTASGLTAGGWESMTRLARGDVAMGTGILATNRAPVAERLRELRTVLDEWIDLLDEDPAPDPEAIGRRLAAARARLDGNEA